MEPLIAAKYYNLLSAQQQLSLQYKWLSMTAEAWYTGHDSHVLVNISLQYSAIVPAPRN